MDDQQPQDEWVELPADRLDDLDVPEDVAAEVKGGAVDMFIKFGGSQSFLKIGSKVLIGGAASPESLSGGLRDKGLKFK